MKVFDDFVKKTFDLLSKTIHFWFGLAGRLTGWLAGWLVGWLAGWLGGWVAGLARWLAGWLAGWLAAWLAGWLVGWLAGWLANWLAGCWPAGLLPCWLADHYIETWSAKVRTSYQAFWCWFYRLPEPRPESHQIETSGIDFVDFWCQGHKVTKSRLLGLTGCLYPFLMWMKSLRT